MVNMVVPNDEGIGIAAVHRYGVVAGLKDFTVFDRNVMNAHKANPDIPSLKT